jgi:exopolysaccharide production protein ExoQ
MSNVMTKKTLENSQLKIEDIAFWFWFYLGLEGIQTFLLFQGNPILGTVVGYLPTLGFTLFLLSSFLISKRISGSKVLQTTTTKLLIALLMWIATTLLWTYSSSVFSAFGYWAATTMKVLVVILLLFLGNTEKVALKSLEGLVMGGVAFAIITLLANPMTEDGRLGHEEFLHPNTIGNNMAMASICSLYLGLDANRLTSRPRTYIFVIVILLLTLLRSLSKTAIFCFLIATLVYLGFSKISQRKKVIIFSIIGGLIAISSVALSRYFLFYLTEQQDGNALTTASGRTNIWRATLSLIREKPLLGYGFQSYKDAVDQIIALRLVHAHNEILNIWFTLGLVGLILCTVIYFSYLFLLRRGIKQSLPQANLGTALLIYSIVRGMTEASVTDPMIFPMTLMTLTSEWIFAGISPSSAKQYLIINKT